MSMSRWGRGIWPLASLLQMWIKHLRLDIMWKLALRFANLPRILGTFSGGNLRRLFLSFRNHENSWIVVRFDKHTVKICNKSRFFPSPGISKQLQDPATGRLIYHFCEQLSKVDLRQSTGSSQTWLIIFSEEKAFSWIFHGFPYILRQSDFFWREEWRSCSEVTLNELWRYDIRGNKWEPDTKDRRATSVLMCFLNISNQIRPGQFESSH